MTDKPDHCPDCPICGDKGKLLIAGEDEVICPECRKKRQRNDGTGPNYTRWGYGTE